VIRDEACSGWGRNDRGDACARGNSDQDAPDDDWQANLHETPSLRFPRSTGETHLTLNNTHLDFLILFA
jgi:hypothetical protein